MGITTIIFSPTGGTERVARHLAEAMGGEVDRVDLTSRSLGHIKLTDGDVALIAVPSFSGRVPVLAIERLRRVSGNGARAVLVAVYGNRAYEDTLVELADAARECGFRVIGAVAAVARHSIVNKIAADRPDSDDCRVLSDFGAKIKGKIERGDLADIAIPGNRPYRKSASGLTPMTARECNSCGKCAAQCPAGAIDPANPRKIDSAACIGCMRCVSVCPTGAKRVSRLMVAAAAMMLKRPCAVRKEPELFI